MNPRIAVVLAGGEDKRCLRRVFKEVRWVELRIDLFLRKFREADLVDWIRTIRHLGARRLIGTVRWHKEQCPPRKPLSEKKRLSLYQEILPLVDYVDVELKSPIASAVAEEARRQGKKVILSWHNFYRTPRLPVLKQLFQASRRVPHEVFKVACRVNCPDELLGLLQFLSLHRTREKIVLTPMGVSPAERLIPLYFGSLFTYAFLTGKTAPGQLSYREVKDFLRE